MLFAGEIWAAKAVVTKEDAAKRKFRSFMAGDDEAETISGAKHLLVTGT